MKIVVKLFAAARQAAGAGDVSLDLPDGATLADVEQQLVARLPALAAIVSHSRWALDAAFSHRNTKVTQNTEIALIPPVSGG